MDVHVTEIHPTNVNEVDYVEAPDHDGVVGEGMVLLIGDWHGLKVKGLQIGQTLLWFTPEEQVALAEFFAEEVK